MENGILWRRKHHDSKPFTKKQEKLIGGLEEIILALNVNASGKWIAKRFFAPVRHAGKPGKRIGPNHESFIHDTLIHENNAIKEATKLIGKQYRFGDRVFNAGWDFPVDKLAQKRIAESRRAK
jgi:hypothetical protein